MNIKNIIETIFQMEEELDLFNRQINGVYFWEAIRFTVVNQIAGKIIPSYGQRHTTFSDIKSGAGWSGLNALKKIFYKNPLLASKSDLLFIGASRRALMEDGLWWDIYCDPVIDYLKSNRKCVLYEIPILETHLAPPKTEKIRHLDFVFFLKNRLIRQKLIRVNFSSGDKLSIYKIEKQIKERFGADINLQSLIYYYLIERKSTLPLYAYLIKRINPKIVVFICSYGREVLVEACKNLGIPSVELQHGTINSYHAGYSFEGKKAIKRNFPDYFLAFGDYWKNLVKFPIPEDRIYSVGFPFFERERAKLKNEHKRNQVVFVSQGPYGKKLSQLAVNLKNRHDFGMEIVYKIHPGEYYRWKKDYPWLVGSGIRVVGEDNSEPLYKLLAQSKVLVGVSSTTIYEGFGFGLRTFLVDPPDVEHMNQLIASQAVVKISSADELIQHLNQPHQQGRVSVDHFFKPNAIENISHALDTIMASSQ